MRFLLGLLSRLIPSYNYPVTTDGIRRVLVVDPNFIGDMLLSSPVYRALKRNLPSARVETLIYAFTRDALSMNPFIDEIHLLPGGNLLRQLPALLSLSRKKYDLVLHLNTLLRTTFLLFLFGSSYRPA